MAEPTKWYKLEVKSVLERLKSFEAGLSKVEARNRLAQYGPNSLEKAHPTSAFKILMDQLRNFIIYVLLLAAILTFISDNTIEFYVISSIILFVVGLGFFQEFRARKSLDSLKSLGTAKATVFRDGTKFLIDAKKLIPGDIIFLEEGIKVPADARLIEVGGLKVDESTLTGESSTVAKSNLVLDGDQVLAEQSNMIFSGTLVVGGNAKAVVVETGIRSEVGHISKLMASIHEVKTPLQKKIDVMSKNITFVVFGICLLLFGVSLLQRWPVETIDIFDSLILVIAVAVSGIPESFPAVITVALASGVNKMARQKVIIKRLPAVETLGSVNVICSDKTGTLTRNLLAAKKIFVDLNVVDVSINDYNPIGTFNINEDKVDPLITGSLETLCEIVMVCNNSHTKQEDENWVLHGDPTDGALLTLAKAAGLNHENIKKKYPRVKELPFDPYRKMMSTVNKTKEGSVLMVKGSYESVIEKSNRILIENRIVKLTPKMKQELLRVHDKFAIESLRVLALAYKPIASAGYSENSLIFVGLVGLKDLPRDGVMRAISDCHKAGIDVIMITGDNKTTAQSIGQELGIIRSEADKVLSSKELERLTEEQFLTVIDQVKVYARTTPEQKFRIVKALQKAGKIVAMTGDGVNDAPALDQADCGVAMGLSGTDVARESADIVITDDNFSTIVSAIKEGRTIYSNIRRFIYYLLTGNITEVLIIATAVMLGVSLPLTALMVLFINIVTSDVPALALSVEPSHGGVMRQKPRNPKEPLLNDYILLKIGTLVPVLMLGTTSLFMWMLAVRGGTLSEARTVAFVTLILFELFHALNARSLHHTIFKKEFLTSNSKIFFAIGVSLVATLWAVYSRFGQDVFGTAPLTLDVWFIILVVSSLVIFVVEMIKLFVKSEIVERKKLGMIIETKHADSVNA
ncbi:HAD-IC family P-type ATPase [Candidatus Woesearchaeota archaeon]|nr:HAD-IC family P-type ATPase [Candidatus Woesearchaeota archaeon]